MIRFLKYIILINIVFLSSVQSQTLIDSADRYSFQELEKTIDDYTLDRDTRAQFSRLFIKKAKALNDTTKILDGFYYLSLNIEYEKAHKYADSIITISKNKEYKGYPEKGYRAKGSTFFKQYLFKKAMQYYLLSEKAARKNHNRKYLYEAKYTIGLLKNTWGKPEDALSYFKAYNQYVDSLNESKIDYLHGLFSISDCYINCKKYDSAGLYINKGLEAATKEQVVYYYFLCIKGNNEFKKGNHREAKEILHNLINTKKASDADRLYSHLYLGNLYYKEKQYQKSVNHYIQFDSIQRELKAVTPEYINPYRVLIAYDDEEKKDYYYKRMLYMDSVCDENYLIDKEIYSDYEVPLILESKDNRIKELEGHYSNSKYWIIFLLGFAGIMVSALMYRNRNYHQKYLVLEEEYKETLNNKSKKKPIELVENTLSDEVVVNILHSLEEFEQNQLFLDSKCSLIKVSKKLNTNSSYLSKIVNQYKGVNFTTYLNHLRINYALQKLREDPVFQNYTIKAIAQESGFNSAQAFSNAFYKKTGIYPSYFIKQLKSRKTINGKMGL